MANSTYTRIWRPPIIDKITDEIVEQTRIVDKKTGERLIPDDEVTLSVIGMYNPGELELARARNPLQLSIDKKGFPTYDSWRDTKRCINMINREQKYDMEIIARPLDNSKPKRMVLSIGQKEKPKEYKDAALVSAKKTQSRMKGEERKYHRLMRIVRNPAKVQQTAIALQQDIIAKKRRGRRRK